MESNFNPLQFYRQGAYYLIRDNMKFNLDPAKTTSYGGSGTTVNNICLPNSITNGTLYNTMTFSSSNSGIFTYGTNGILGLGDVLDTELVAGKFTIAGWFYPTSSTSNYTNWLFAKYTGTGGSANRMFFSSIRNTTASSYGGLKVDFYYSGVLGTTQFRLLRGNTTITTNTWHHIAFTFDKDITTNNGLDKVKIYINGNLETNTMVSTAGTQPTALPVGSGSPFCIGNSTDVSYANPVSIFQGSVGQTCFYDRILSQTEIQIIYNTLKNRYQ